MHDFLFAHAYALVHIICFIQHSEEIQTISVCAQQEMVLEEMLEKVRAMWVDCEFELNPYKEQKVSGLQVHSN
jgi:hypothetical protein